MHERRLENTWNTKREILLPTPEEDAAIRAGIAADPDTRELTTEEIASMRPVSEVLPHVVERYLQTRDGKKAARQRKSDSAEAKELTAISPP